MNKQRKPPKHPGGRPPFYADRMVKISVMIPKYQYQHILKVGKNVSQVIRIIVDKDIDNADQPIRSADVKI